MLPISTTFFILKIIDCYLVCRRHHRGGIKHAENVTSSFENSNFYWVDVTRKNIFEGLKVFFIKML